MRGLIFVAVAAASVFMFSTIAEACPPAAGGGGVTFSVTQPQAVQYQAVQPVQRVVTVQQPQKVIVRNVQPVQKVVVRQRVRHFAPVQRLRLRAAVVHH